MQATDSIFQANKRDTAPFETTHTEVRLPELLAPAGDWECARAAVENGADAIYFGLDRFNARMRAHNFIEADLPALMEFLHRRGVRGYVTFNTLVFPDELPEAEHYLRAIMAAGVDAAIVQDVGICRLIRRLSPDFPIHASTQMTVTSAAGAEFVRELGCDLVVLARECSIREIETLRAALDDKAISLPLEVFVHGALCVAYSGQCLTSESLGGRSANRGECAQACRMPYDLISDGVQVPLGDRRYLLSPQDLAGLSVLPELARAGVSSLKIEGRLKTPEYVASITRVYRAAINQLAAEQSPAPAEEQTAARYELEMGFSRGLFTGWLGGNDNQRLVHARFGKKRGVYLGSVEQVRGDRVFVRLEAPLKAGDGVVFDAGRPDAQEEGGRVHEVSPPTPPGDQTLTALSFGWRREGLNIDLTRVRVGDKIWKTSDPELDRRLRQTFAGDNPRFQRPIHIEAHGHDSAPLTLIFRDELGHIVQVESAMPLVTAGQRPFDSAQLHTQLGRLGGTGFKLVTLDNFLEGSVMLPVSELNRLRREAVARMETLRAAPRRWTINEPDNAAFDVSARDHETLSPAVTEDQLLVLLRTSAQLDAVLESNISNIYCDFEDPKKYREAVTRVRAKSDGAPRRVYVAPPRIFKSGEEWILQQVLSSDADGYLVRNYDHLRFFGDKPCVGDFSLNVTNPLSAEYFKQRFGLKRLTASYDMNATQLESLLRVAPPAWFEVTIHQHMPMFHMEHCVFCAFLSAGTDYRNCGRPCDKHEVRLRDRVGLEHPLKADAGCRNTVYNARAQTGAESVQRLQSLGLRHFRIEFVNETSEQVSATLTRYRALLSGEISGAQLWRELKLQNQLGVTRGQLEQGESRKVFSRAVPAATRKQNPGAEHRR